MAVKDNTLVLGMIGRSIWDFEELPALRALMPEVRARQAKEIGLPGIWVPPAGL